MLEHSNCINGKVESGKPIYRTQTKGLSMERVDKDQVTTVRKFQS